MKRYYKDILIGLFFLLLAIVASRIWAIHPLYEIIGDGGDKYEYFGYMHLANQNMSHMSLPFSFTNTLRYPYGFDFSYGRDGTLVVLFGALLGFVFPLALAYNLTVVAILWCNLTVTFYVLKKILILSRVKTDSISYIAFIGALIEGWSPYVFAHLNGQLNLSLIIGLPILFYVFFRLGLSLYNRDQLKLAHFVHISLAYLLISLSSAQYLLIAVQASVIVFAAYLIIFAYQRRNLSVFKDVFTFVSTYRLYLFLAALTFLIPFVFFQGGYIKAIITKQVNFDSVEVLNPQIRPKIIDIFIPNAYLGDWWSKLNSTYVTIEKQVGFGIIGWLIVLAYALKEKQRRHLRDIASLLAVLLATLLFFKPLFVPEPARSWIVLSFPVVAIIALRVQCQKKAVFMVLILLLLFERGFYSIMKTSPFPIKAAEVVKRQPGSAVMHVPLVTKQGYHSALSYFWKKSVIDGYFLHIANTPFTNTLLSDSDMAALNCETSNADLLKNFNPDAFIQKLKDNDVQIIVLIKKGQNGDLWHNPECKYVRRAWDKLLPDRIQHNGDVVIEHKFIEPADTIHKRVYADMDGVLRLERLTVWPRSINDISIATPGGTISPDWSNATVNNNDLIVDYFPRLFFPLRQGEYIELLSNTSSEKTEIYPMIYYYYDVDKTPTQSGIYNRRQPYPYYLSLLWKDNEVEVYAVK